MAWTPFTRLDCDRRGQHYTSDLTDAEYALILPYRPAQPPRGRRRRTDLQAVVDGVFYVLQNGCPWATLLRTFLPRAQSIFSALPGMTPGPGSTMPSMSNAVSWRAVSFSQAPPTSTASIGGGGGS